MRATPYAHGASPARRGTRDDAAVATGGSLLLADSNPLAFNGQAAAADFC